MFVVYLKLLALLLVIAWTFIFIIVLLPQFMCSLYYLFRLESRNKALQDLAKKYGLNFKKDSISLGSIFLRIFRPFEDEEVNCLYGQINEHEVQIKDVFVITSWAVTVMIIDGKRSTSIAGLTPIDSIRKKLCEFTGQNNEDAKKEA